MWPAIQEGNDSERDEVFHNLEPFREAARQGEWKLIWTTKLPCEVELYYLGNAPNET